jgi:hypothetical protein
MAGFWRLIFVRPRKTKICYLQDAAVVDQEISRFHVAM